MRKLVVSILMSLDGYAAGPGGNVMMLPLDESFSAYNLERLRSADTLLLGRITFEAFRAYWPSIADDLAQSETEREISRRNTAALKIVVSDTITAADTAGWGETVVVARAEAADIVRRLKREDGADILVFGSMGTYNALLAAGVVDEVHVMVGNGLLGDGVRAFTVPLDDRLRLLETRQLDGSDNVLLVYAIPDQPHGR